MDSPPALALIIKATRFFVIIFFFFLATSSISVWWRPPPFASATDFLFNSFGTQENLVLVGDARLDAATIRLTNDSNEFSFGRAFYPLKLNTTAPSSNASSGGRGGGFFSFSTSFVFSVLPANPSSPGFGLAFVLSNSTSPPSALTGQYFGLFSNSTRRTPAPLLAVEFDTGRNPELNDHDGNHVGIDLNYIESAATAAAGYYTTASNASFVPIDMRSGANIRAWVEFDGAAMRIDVTLAPAGADRKPPRPLLSYTDPTIAEYLSREMYVGFSASKVTWVEAQRVLAWSFSDTGRPARNINTTGLPVFLPPPSPKSKSKVGLIVGVVLGATAALGLCLAAAWYRCFRGARRRSKKKNGKIDDDDKEAGVEDDEVEDWEMEFWPRRFGYGDLSDATDGFSRGNMLGYGGFGKVYKGVLKAPTKSNPDSGVSSGDSNPNTSNTTSAVDANDTTSPSPLIAVKVVSHDSKQGLQEFMAEISSMGRLQHKSLVPMRGWCRRGKQLMLVYDYMPNGSLNRWIFGPHNTTATSASSNATTSSSTSSSAGGDKRPPVPPSTLLGWEARKRVLADVAEGLLYLHQGWDKVVLHRDVKPSNILLDGNMRGRLGDFGLAKLHGRGETPGATRVVGTLGYLAPELARIPAPTPASDVYSYGVVVLETCAGRKAFEMLGSGEDDEDFVLVDWARGLYKQGRIAEAADRRVVVSAAEVAEAELVVKLGLACCHPDPEQRPTMKEVVDVLLGVLKVGGVSDNAGEPFNRA